MGESNSKLLSEFFFLIIKKYIYICQEDTDTERSPEITGSKRVRGRGQEVGGGS